MTIGADTYITVEDATAYVNAHYTSAQTVWAGLSDSDRDILLRKAAQVLDRQPYVGTKAEYSQLMAFPRALYTEHSGAYIGLIRRTGTNWYAQPEVPAEVKHAQVEIALQLAAGTPKRVELQRQGVKSFSVGKLSESYGSGKASPLPYEAQELLKPYLAGSVRIC